MKRRRQSKKGYLAVPPPCPQCGSNRWKTNVKGALYTCRICGRRRDVMAMLARELPKVAEAASGLAKSIGKMHLEVELVSAAAKKVSS